MRRPAFLIAATMMMQATTGLASAGTLTLTVDANSGTGQLRAAVFESQAAFDSDKVVAVSRASAKGAGTVMTLDALKPGTYGIAVYLDENGNEKLDTNVFGAPTEPFGFSMNPKLGFSAPKFEAFKFDFDGTDTALDIKLNGG